MSQFSHGVIDPDTKNGTDLASDIEDAEAAQNSNHSGASRPSYAVAGMTWVKTVSATVHEVYYFDGTDDILLNTVNPTANTNKGAFAEIVLDGVERTSWDEFIRVVDTISDLRDLTILAAGESCQPLGYYDSGDGGGGPLRKSVTGAAPGTYVDNGGSIIVPTGGDGSEAWVWEHSGPVNIKWFGAKPDNATDIYTPFLAALTTGESVVIGESGETYLLSTSLEYKLATNQAVYCQGGRVTINVDVNTIGIHFYGNTGDFGTENNLENVNLVYAGTSDTASFTDAAVNATTDVITVVDHGCSSGDVVAITGGGAAIGGMIRGMTYYVSVSGNDLTFYRANPSTGITDQVDITSAGSGTYTLTKVATGLLINGIRHFSTNNLYITGFDNNLRISQEVRGSALGNSGSHYGNHRNLRIGSGKCGIYNSIGANQQEFFGGKILENVVHFHAGGTVSSYWGTSFEGAQSLDSLGYISSITAFIGTRFESSGSGRVTISPTFTDTIIFMGNHFSGSTAPSSYESADVVNFGSNSNQFLIANQRLELNNVAAAQELLRFAGNTSPTRQYYNSGRKRIFPRSEAGGIGGTTKAQIIEDVVEYQTLNETPVAIWSFDMDALGTRTTALISWDISSKKDGTSIANYTVERGNAMITQSGGSVTIVDQTVYYNKTSSGTTYLLVVDGDDITLQATGVAATTINHFGIVRISELGN